MHCFCITHARALLHSKAVNGHLDLGPLTTHEPSIGGTAVPWDCNTIVRCSIRDAVCTWLVKGPVHVQPSGVLTPGAQVESSVYQVLPLSCRKRHVKCAFNR